MSFGDEIMASGHALVEHRRTGKRVKILDRRGLVRWSSLWEGLDWIVRPGERVSDFVTVRNGPQCRPYITYPFNRRLGYTFSNWRARDHIGVLSFHDSEVEFASRHLHLLGGKYVVVEPHIPKTSNPNKQWGWDRWQAMVDLLPEIRWVQLGAKGIKSLRGVEFIESTFREAAAVISKAEASVLPEGGLHHAAGALRRRAVVLFGGCIDVRATGYLWHDNIVDDSVGSPCGNWLPCQHCTAIWDHLKPSEVARRLTVMLENV